MKKIIKRIEMSQSEYRELIGALNELETTYSFFTAIKEAKTIEITSKKRGATKRATQTRILLSKEKIQNAINILRMENRIIDYKSISETGEVSIVTVKKYISFDDLIVLNKNIEIDKLIGE